ncbi:hypothetical protein V5799_026797 [Amblyomma americanum]|uniref:Secreted protein n=1 Tax=Amblyomma americanum TaxID=6943 RepID=A0AAQ4DHJ6_AMBAM
MRILLECLPNAFFFFRCFAHVGTARCGWQSRAEDRVRSASSSWCPPGLLRHQAREELSECSARPLTRRRLRFETDQTDPPTRMEGRRSSTGPTPGGGVS